MSMKRRSQPALMCSPPCQVCARVTVSSITIRARCAIVAGREKHDG
jgi:hypothetical protein